MKQDFEISTDTSRLDIEMIHSFLSEESYWANKRTLEQTKTAIENSICFGVYQGEEQVGFARVVTDKANCRKIAGGPSATTRPSSST